MGEVDPQSSEMPMGELVTQCESPAGAAVQMPLPRFSGSWGCPQCQRPVGVLAQIPAISLIFL